MKTLGEVAFEASRRPEDMLTWEIVCRSYDSTRRDWENAAQAVRAAVIEECAKVCDELHGPWRNDDLWQGGVVACSEAIRSLK